VLRSRGGIANAIWQGGGSKEKEGEKRRWLISRHPEVLIPAILEKGDLDGSGIEEGGEERSSRNGTEEVISSGPPRGGGERRGSSMQANRRGGENEKGRGNECSLRGLSQKNAPEPSARNRSTPPNEEGIPAHDGKREKGSFPRLLI